MSYHENEKYASWYGETERRTLNIPHTLDLILSIRNTHFFRLLNCDGNYVQQIGDDLEKKSPSAEGIEMAMEITKWQDTVLSGGIR